MFYDKFIALCVEKGMSPSAVAEDIGLRKSNVTYWKKGRNSPSNVTLKKIADYFGVPVDFLEGETDTKEKTPAVIGEGHSKEAIQFLERFKDLPSEAWEELAAFAEFQAAKHKHTER